MTQTRGAFASLMRVTARELPAFRQSYAFRLATPRPITAAAYEAFRRGLLSKAHARELGCVGAVLNKPFGERHESTASLKKRNKLTAAGRRKRGLA